jgi:hypothetical protein
MEKDEKKMKKDLPNSKKCVSLQPVSEEAASSLTILRDYNEVKCKNNISRSKIRLIQFHKES